MQHYGCPTRLLDITSNPLVALYFSCIGNNGNDGIVYVFSVRSNDVLYAKSDRLQMLAKFTEFSSEDQEKLRAEAYIYLRKENAPLMNDSTYGASVLERFFHAIKRDNAGFERKIRTMDLLMPKVVQPIRNNNRIMKQDGAFIISGLDFNEDDSNRKIKFLVQNKYIIKCADKQRIVNDLEKIGVHQASLFPEVDQVAAYLKSSNNVR